MMSKIIIRASFTATEELVKELLPTQQFDLQSDEARILNVRESCDLNKMLPEHFLGAIRDLVSVNGFLSMFITRAEEETE